MIRIAKTRLFTLILCMVVAPFIRNGDHITYAQEVATPAEAGALVSQAISSLRQEPAFQAEDEEENEPEIDTGEIEDESKDEGDDVSAVNFYVATVDIDGNTVVPDDNLREIKDGYEERDVSLGDLKDLSREITRHYRSKGYITSRAYVPPQDIVDQKTRIQVMEGKIKNVYVEGNKHYRDEVFTDQVEFGDDEIFEYSKLQHSIKTLNKIRGLRTKAYLVPGDDPGYSDIILKPTEAVPIKLSYNLHNRGANSTHYTRHVHSLDHYSLTGWGDVLKTQWIHSEEGSLYGWPVSYEFPINARKTFLTFNASYIKSILVKHRKSREIKGRNFSLVPGIRHSFINDPLKSLEAYLHFEIKDSKTMSNDLRTYYDRMRVVVAGVSSAVRDNYGATYLDAAAHFGIPDLLGGSGVRDARTTAIRSGGDFERYTGTIFRMHRLDRLHTIILRGSGQWSPDSLTLLERFRVGGAYSVRGYPESDSTGDYGFNVSAQLTTPFYIEIPHLFTKESELWPTKIRLYDSLQWVFFLDAGKTYLTDRSNPTEQKDKWLMGTGAGLRLKIEDNFWLDADMGIPVGDPSIDKDRYRFHVDLNYIF